MNQMDYHSVKDSQIGETEQIRNMLPFHLLDVQLYGLQRAENVEDLLSWSLHLIPIRKQQIYLHLFHLIPYKLHRLIHILSTLWCSSYLSFKNHGGLTDINLWRLRQYLSSKNHGGLDKYDCHESE